MQIPTDVGRLLWCQQGGPYARSCVAGGVPCIMAVFALSCSPRCCIHDWYHSLTSVHKSLIIVTSFAVALVTVFWSKTKSIP